ncbi:MAG TPA: phage tail protein [Phycisphaerae bacterium]|nr:phage tail protein [Phycisphaerae bacterium]
MPESRVGDPATAYRFQVTARANSISVGFTRIAGLRDETEVIEYREGSDYPIKTKIPGLRTFPVVTMTRGITATSLGLKQWRDDVIKCVDFRSEVVVTVRNCDESPARRIVFERAWPNALEIGDLDAGSSEVAVETMELQHQGRTTVSIFDVGGTDAQKITGR